MAKSIVDEPGEWFVAVVAGVIVTKVSYLIPIVHFIAPIFGGAVTAYMLNRGPLDGLKAGFIKGVSVVPIAALLIFFCGCIS